MANIFISWSSGDEKIALPLSKALQNAGFEVTEYSEDATGGGIDQNVRRYVDEAKLAVFVLSPGSIGKQWIQTEVDWCYYRRVREGRPEIIPLMVGTVAKTDLPHLIQKDPLLRTFPVPAGPLSSDNLIQLQETIRQTLDLPSPIVVPAAFFAMTRSQATTLLEEGKMNDLLSGLCSTVGMEPFPALAKSLLNRYGDKPEDFAPFPGGTLKEFVQQTIGQTNASRRLEGDDTPLWIWWCTEALLNQENDDNELASTLWERGPSIAIVDSISVLHPDVRQLFTNMPEPEQAATSALLWVPPYTLHTAQLEEVTESSVKQLNKLLRKYKKWGSESGGSYLAFDIGTRPTLRRWIHQAFVNVQARPKPRSDNVAAMRKTEATGFGNTSAFWTQQVPK